MARLWLRPEGYSCTQAMYRSGSERNKIIELESVDKAREQKGSRGQRKNCGGAGLVSATADWRGTI